MKLPFGPILLSEHLPLAPTAAKEEIRKMLAAHPVLERGTSSIESEEILSREKIKLDALGRRKYRAIYSLSEKGEGSLINIKVLTYGYMEFALIALLIILVAFMGLWAYSLIVDPSINLKGNWGLGLGIGFFIWTINYRINQSRKQKGKEEMEKLLDELKPNHTLHS
ncbi:MAG: hypothetical protein AAFY71_02660 [Bacteroidota bacterium]